MAVDRNMEMELIRSVAFFLLVAFLPSVLWVVWLVRRGARGPGLFSMLAMFVWGAVFAVIIAVALGLLIPGFSPWQYTGTMFFAVVILAPLVEEFAKPLGLRMVENDMVRVRDGTILGATAGLGFAATENLLYGLAALGEGGWVAFWVTAVLRGVAACALHAAAAGMTGRGYAWASTGGRSLLAVVPFYLLAVIMHALYNYLAIQGTLPALTAAILLALGAMAYTGYSLR